jgi:hypothetical protein
LKSKPTAPLVGREIFNSNIKNKMKKFALISFLAMATVLASYWLYLRAADHIDAPAVTNMSTDITDFYAFQSPASSSNMVFVVNSQGLLSPTSSATAAFDSNTMLEINIDNSGDNVEDLVIQCVFEDGKVKIYGPIKPKATGKTSELMTSATLTEAQITAYTATSPTIGNTNNIKVFAGPRDDPFFFDLTSYKAILAGTQPGGFNSPGADTFAGTNVMSVVVELPKTLLGTATTLNTWVESKKKI